MTSGLSIRTIARDPRWDADLERLLYDAYVPPGFTDAARARSVFNADAIHARGTTLGAFDAAGRLLGTVTLVRGESEASRLARADEIEVHLLAVCEGARGRGIGEALVSSLLRLPDA